jgi:hypothetical protein
VVDGEGAPLRNVAVCLVYGSAAHVQRNSDRFSAAQIPKKYSLQ